jgi:hypothetical protein
MHPADSLSVRNDLIADVSPRTGALLALLGTPCAFRIAELTLVLPSVSAAPRLHDMQLLLQDPRRNAYVLGGAFRRRKTCM